jgi:hypothetical protein
MAVSLEDRAVKACLDLATMLLLLPLCHFFSLFPFFFSSPESQKSQVIRDTHSAEMVNPEVFGAILLYILPPIFERPKVTDSYGTEEARVLQRDVVHLC